MDSSVEMPASFNKKLLNTLRTCGNIFDDDHTLRNLFIDDRLSPWRDKIPTARRQSTRIRNLIALLHNQHNYLHNKNALVLFLELLQEDHHPNDSCHHQLQKLAKAWQAILDQPTNYPTTQLI